MKHVKVAFLGLGNVGGGVYSVLEAGRSQLLHREQICFDVKRVLVRDPDKPRPVAIPPGVLTTSFEDILNDLDIDLVAEFMGGEEPAAGYMEQLLRRGKSVVTANKEALAKHWPALAAAQRLPGAGQLFFEATVGGGIPILRTLTDSLQANDIRRILGIINGTTNFILTQMGEHGRSYTEALATAQQMGLAEPDPTNDVEGYDAVYKLAILSTLAFHKQTTPADIFCEGITGIDQDDLRYARELGYNIKLLAIGKKSGDSIEVRVHPTLIPLSHPLASVRDAYNAIFASGSAVGDMMLWGQGAGARPTASAIISDMVMAARGTTPRPHSVFDGHEFPVQELTFTRDWECKYYLRIEAYERPGVLAAMARVLGDNAVSVEAVIQKRNDRPVVPVIFVTHRTREEAMMKAVRQIEGLDVIQSVHSVIRVEDEG